MFQVLNAPIETGKLDTSILNMIIAQFKPNGGQDMYAGVEKLYLEVKDTLKKKDQLFFMGGTIE